MTGFPSLPCYPCPHQSACCAYGVSVTETEASAILALRGDGYIYRTRWGEWRTRVKKRRCAFLKDNACTIYEEAYYPVICRGFPWIDGETGGPYEWDQTICPEFIARPELVQIGRA